MYENDERKESWRMSSTGTKKNRMLEIFFRAMKGENISVKKLADEYGVSVKSISRDLGEIKNFLCENRELVGKQYIDQLCGTGYMCFGFKKERG